MAGKVDNVYAKMQRLPVSILGLSRVRWLKAGKQETRMTSYHSKVNDRMHQYGIISSE